LPELLKFLYFTGQ